MWQDDVDEASLDNTMASYLVAGNSFDSVDSVEESKSGSCLALSKPSDFSVSVGGTPRHILALGEMVDRLVTCNGSASLFRTPSDFEYDDKAYDLEYCETESFLTNLPDS